MKTALLAVTLLLAATFGYTQSTFIKSFGGADGSEEVTNLKKVNANKFLVVGYTQNFGAGNNDIYVVCVNKDGSLLWSKTYGTAKSEKNAKCAVTSDGGFLLTAEMYDSTGSTANSLLIIKCKPGGNIEWSKTFKSSSFPTINTRNALQAADGGYYITADPSNYSAVDDYVMLLKLDAAGNMQWHKTINTLPQDYYRSADITEMEDGSVALAGKFSVSLLENAGSAAFMVLDNSGTVNSFKTLYCSTCDPSYVSTYINKIYSKNKQLYFVGSISYAGKYFWLKAGRNTTTVDASTIEQSDFSMQYLVNNNIIQLPDDQVGSLLFVNDGSMLRAYRYFIGQTFNYDMLLYKYDAQGRICSNNYKAPKIDTVIKKREFVLTDKSFAMFEDSLTAGSVTLTTTNVTAEATECIGNAPSLTATTIESINTINNNAFIYPNPAVNNITVSFNSSAKGIYNIAVTSADGRTLNTLKVNATAGINKIPVNITALTKGIYFIKISGSNQQTILKFVKE